MVVYFDVGSLIFMLPVVLSSLDVPPVFGTFEGV
jgi:hypothetical protein